MNRSVPVALLALALVGCEADRPIAAGDTTRSADTSRTITLDERVDDSARARTALDADTAPEAGPSTRLVEIDARLFNSRSGSFTTVGDSVNIPADTPSGALLVLVTGHAPGGTIPATVELVATEGERTVFSAGYTPSFQVDGDGEFRAPFLVYGERCGKLELVARSEGGRELSRAVVFSCGSGAG